MWVAATALASPAVGLAQTSTYLAAEYGAPFTPLPAGNALTFMNTRTGAVLVPLGFTFPFFGERYTAINVGLNGVLTLAAECGPTTPCTQGSCSASQVCEEPSINAGPSGNPPFPSGLNPNRYIAPFWDDLALGPSSQVAYAVVGTAPRREWVVEYRDIERFSGGGSRATFQVRLEESTGVIRLRYGGFTAGSDASAWRGTIGVENPSGTVGVTSRACASTDSCSALDLTDLVGKSLDVFPRPSGAELVARAEAPTGASPGAAVPVTVEASNLGTGTTTVAFEARVYLSADAVIDRADRELGVLSFSALTGGQTARQTLTATIPAVPLGIYTLGALVDTSSVVAEAFEENNVAIARSRFLVGADLSLEVFAPTSGGIGDPLPIPVTLRNFGGSQPAVAIDLYLSADAVLDARDPRVATTTVAVPTVPSTALIVQGQAPPNLPQGSYRVIGRIDPGDRVPESDETNNLSVSDTARQFLAVDLYAPSLTVDRLLAFRGQQIGVTVEIVNEGGSTARGFDYDFYLSTNELISRISDPRLGSAGLLTLAVGETARVSHTFTISSTIPPDLYYVGVLVNANGRVTEINLNDNSRRSVDRVVVRDPAPDFGVGQVAAPPGGAAGERLVLERAFFNTGNAAGSASYEIWLSEDQEIDAASDIRLLSASTTIAVGGEDFGLDVIRLSPALPAGDYYVLYRLDPQDRVDELDETNNEGGTDAPLSFVSARLDVRTQSLPFGTVGVPYGAVLAVDGGVGPYAWSRISGQLPEGLMLEPEGRISGTPAREGVFVFRLAVTDGVITVERDFQILVAEQTEPLEVLTRTLNPGYVGRRYVQNLVAYGGVPPYLWTTNVRLPLGLVLSSDGEVVGTPTEQDIAVLDLQVADRRGRTASRPVVLRVLRNAQAIRLSAEALPDGRIGVPYQATVEVESNTGTEPILLTVSEGALPDGLTRDGGEISGTPTRAGLFDFTLRATDADGEVDENRYLIDIAELQGVRFLTTSLPEGRVGAPYLDRNGDPVVLEAVSDETETEFAFRLVGGALPLGLELSAEGTLSGTVARAGVFDLIVEVEDVAGQKALRAFGLLVNEGGGSFEMPEAPAADSGCVCVSRASSRSWGAVLGLWAVAWVLYPRFWRTARRREPRSSPLKMRALGRALHRLLLVTLVGAGSLASGVAEGQTSINYQVVSRLDGYRERAGGTPITFNQSNNGFAQITLPFVFNYFGVGYNVLSVSSNGFVELGPANAVSSSNQALPSTLSPNKLIALVWDDMESPGEEWFVEGTAPNRRVIIQYRNAHRLGAAAEGRFRAQLHLLEGRARFEVHYGGVAGAGPFSGWSFSAGFEDSSGRFGADFLGCQSTCTRDQVPNGVAYIVQEDRGQDLIARGVTGPASAIPGTSASLVLELESGHARLLGPFEYAIYLLPSSATGPTGTPISTAFTSLEPFEQQRAPVVVTIPSGTPPGRYRLGLELDRGNVIQEPDETNNFALGAFIRVGPAAPDFSAVSIGTTVMTAAPGGTLPVTLELQNAGPVGGEAVYRVVLSRNGVVTADDRAIDEGRATLPAGDRVEVTRQVSIPADVPPGPYTLGVVLDPDNAVAESSEVNNTAAAVSPLLVASTSLAIDERALPPLYVGIEYSTFLRPVGGDGQYTWRVSAGQLPRGIALDEATGELWGVPLEVETAQATLEVASSGQVATWTVELSVVEAIGGFTIVTRQLLPGTLGADYPPPGEEGEAPQRLRTLGAQGTPTFALSEGSLTPPGIELSSDGVFSGRPTQPGRFPLEVEATDEAGRVATRSLVLTIGEPGRLTLVADLLPDGIVGEPYRTNAGPVALRVFGLAANATAAFSTMDGELPPGVVLGSNGVLAGTPDAVGTFDFPVRATERSGQFDTARFRIRVRADDSLRIRLQGTRTTTAGTALEVELLALGGTPPYAWQGAESLPQAFEVDIEGDGGNTLRVQGTLEEPGLVTFLATLTDADQRVRREAVTLRFVAPTPEPPPPAADDGGCRTGAHGSSAGAAGLALLLLLLLRRMTQRRAE